MLVGAEAVIDPDFGFEHVYRQISFAPKSMIAIFAKH